MDYSRALKGPLSRSRVITEIRLQAELELGHSLTKEEETQLFRNFSPQIIFDRIQKVIILSELDDFTHCFILVWVWIHKVHGSTQ